MEELVGKKIFFPSVVSLRAFEDAEGKMNFSYIERFTQEKYGATLREDMLARTFSVVSVALKTSELPVVVERNGADGIEIRGTIDRADLGNMLVGEFFGWSTIGEMSLRDLFFKPMMSLPTE